VIVQPVSTCQRTFVQAHKAHSAVLEASTVGAPQPWEVSATGLGPSGVVIAGDQVARQFQLGKDRPDLRELRERAVFRHVAADHPKRQSSLRVEVADAGPEVRGAGAGADMRVAEPGEAERFAGGEDLARPPEQQPQESQRFWARP
jgi:hypothetical protein